VIRHTVDQRLAAGVVSEVDRAPDAAAEAVDRVRLRRADRILRARVSLTRGVQRRDAAEESWLSV
jgi:hypothetical protein